VARYLRISVTSFIAGATAVGAALVFSAGPASAAPTGCGNVPGKQPAYGVGVAIIPKFVGTNTVAISAYAGEVLDYDVTVFLKTDGVIVCPIKAGTLTVTLPDGNGPFTIATGIALNIGGSVTYQHVPATKYTMSTKDLVPGTSPARVEATAHVEATSLGPDTGAQDDAPVQATATAPTFLLGPSTQVHITPSAKTVPSGNPITWTVTETNDTLPNFFPAALTNVRVDVSADGGATNLLTLTSSSANFSGDTNHDSVLEVGETWKWTFVTNPVTNTTLAATGFAEGPRAHPVTFPADPQERAASPVTVTPPPPPPTPPPTPPLLVPPTLPATGSTSSMEVPGMVGLLLLGAGLVLVAVTRRRRKA
jgi:LPXTG-motif cell wall-anchored protein